MAPGVLIEAVESLPSPAWLELRRELWPDCSDGEHAAETASFLAEPRRYGQFLAFTGERVPLARTHSPNSRTRSSPPLNGSISQPLCAAAGSLSLVFPKARVVPAMQ